jgi:hypothetical protein
VFPITIRNNVTGEEKSWGALQDVANFLAIAPNPEDWTGYEFAGGLPAADPEFLRQHANAVERVTYGTVFGVDADGNVHELTAEDIPPEMAAQLVTDDPQVSEESVESQDDEPAC